MRWFCFAWQHERLWNANTCHITFFQWGTWDFQSLPSRSLHARKLDCEGEEPVLENVNLPASTRVYWARCDGSSVRTFAMCSLMSWRGSVGWVGTEISPPWKHFKLRLAAALFTLNCLNRDNCTPLSSKNSFTTMFPFFVFSAMPYLRASSEKLIWKSIHNYCLSAHYQFVT